MNPAPTSHVFLTSTSLVSGKPPLSLGTDADALPGPFCMQHGGLADAVIKRSGVNLWRNIFGAYVALLLFIFWFQLFFKSKIHDKFIAC